MPIHGWLGPQLFLQMCVTNGKIRENVPPDEIASMPTTEMPETPDLRDQPPLRTAVGGIIVVDVEAILRERACNKQQGDEAVKAWLSSSAHCKSSCAAERESYARIVNHIFRI